MTYQQSVEGKLPGNQNPEAISTKARVASISNNVKNSNGGSGGINKNPTSDSYESQVSIHQESKRDAKMAATNKVSTK